MQLSQEKKRGERVPYPNQHMINDISKCDNFATSPKNSLTTGARSVRLPCMNITRFSLAALLASSVLLTGANSQTTASTDPVGFTTVNVRGKTTAAKAFSTVVIPMERADAYVGSCADASFSLDGPRTVITFGSNLFTAG